MNRTAEYSSGSDSDGAATEAAKATLPYDEMLWITKAKEVAARLGSIEFEFTDNHLESLRELVGLAAPAVTAREGK